MADNHNWFLNVPLSDLLFMQNLPQEFDKVRAENDQLRQELEALRIMLYQLMERFAELKRDCSAR